MVCQKETKVHQVCIRLNDIQYKAVMALGGPTEVIERYIETHAGDAIKTKMAKQHILDNIEAERARIKDFDVLIKAYEEKAAEELKQKKEAKQAKQKPIEKKVKETGLEEWVAKWLPIFQKRLQSKELSDAEYEIIMKRLNFVDRKEADAWIERNESAPFF